MSRKTKLLIKSETYLLAKSKLKSFAKLLLKLGVSGAAVYFVLISVDVNELLTILKEVNIFYILLATIFFIASKVVSAYRLNTYFKNIGLKLSNRLNLKLYSLGMFYNLFLPGGIGGDGYKVYWLNKKYGTKVKPLIGATLLDRISGMVALMFLGFIMFVFISNPIASDNYGLSEQIEAVVSVISLVIEFLYPYKYFVLLGIPLTYIAYYLGVKKAYPVFLKTFTKTTLQSMGVQLLQIVSIYFIIRALGQEVTAEYYFLFLVSSVAAVLPLSVGGLGIREIVFMAAVIFALDKDYAVAISFLFYLITMLVSFVGIIYVLDSKKLEEKSS